MLSCLPMDRRLPILAFVVLGVASCATTPPRTIDALFNGSPLTRTVRLYREKGDALSLVSESPGLALCQRFGIAQPRDGDVFCATVTITLDGDPPNFYLVGWLDFDALYDYTMRGSSFIPTPSEGLRALSGGQFALDGAWTQPACEALRAKRKPARFYVDAACHPAVLTIR